MKNNILRHSVILIILSLLIGCSESVMVPDNPENGTDEFKSTPIEPYYPIPTNTQLDWQNSDMAMFVHFGMNTFTDKEWGEGDDSTGTFNPTNLNTEQWVKEAKDAGFKYIILTVKHHDGFCLWPSQYTDYSIKNSPYKNGKGDIVKEFADACRKYGVNLGFYLSPWDRHDPRYGTDEYNTYYQNQLIELLTKYGKVSEVWVDIANGEGPNGVHQDYNFDLYFSTIRHYQPEALIANMGPDIRWVGNEDGLAAETEWSVQNRIFTIQMGDKVWYPSECDVSIRPGWFYHESENSQVKSVEQLMRIYLSSVGRNSNLLLNIPPNREGLFSDYDVTALRGFKQQLDNIFSKNLFYNQNIEASNTRINNDSYAAKYCLDNNDGTFWVTEPNVLSAEVIVNLNKTESINVITIKEAIEYGQRIKSFSVFAEQNGTWQNIYNGTTIGKSRIITFNAVETQKIKIVINGSFASPALKEIKGYYSNYITEHNLY